MRTSHITNDTTCLSKEFHEIQKHILKDQKILRDLSASVNTTQTRDISAENAEKKNSSLQNNKKYIMKIEKNISMLFHPFVRIVGRNIKFYIIKINI